MASIETCTWDGLQAIELRAAGYDMLIVPELGANVLRLRYFDKDGTVLDILRTPDCAQTLKDDPYAYGIPVLFPANRIAGGVFDYDGVTYTFPQNYPNGVHIHGVLHNYAGWRVAQQQATQEEALVCLEADTQDPVLKACFPVEITVRLTCRLNAKGLTQRFTLDNHSDKTVPFGIAYHTALRVPFCAESKAEDMRLSIPLAARCLDDAVNRLPNGKSGELSPYERALASPEGENPLLEQLDYLYNAVPDTTDAVLRDVRTGKEVVYRAGPEDGYWIIWNSTTKEGFVAVEPQTWLSNGIHLPNPKSHGVLFAPPHTQWSGDTAIFVR